MRTSPPCLYELVGTDGLRPGERFAFFNDNKRRRFELNDVAGDERPAFSVGIRRLIGPEGRFSDIRMTSAGIVRTPRLCRADEVDDIALTISLGGAGAGWFGDPDRTTRLGSGFVRIRDQGSPYTLEWTGTDNHTLHIELPRAMFDSRTLDRVLSAAGTLLPSRGLAPMLTAHMRMLAELAPGLDPAAQAAGLRSVLDLAAAVLRLEFGSQPADSEACADGLFVAAQALIRRRYASIDLSPDEIAHRLGCSRATLYRLFARNGLTVAGYLREIRLERCRAALAAAGPGETVGDIAFRCGFDNPVHFARLFRERFGMRPSEARAASGFRAI